MNPQPLTVEELEQAASAFKEDLMREMKRCIRRGNLNGALCAIAGEEYIDGFANDLKLRIHAPWRAARAAGGNLPRRPSRARPINLSAIERKSQAV